MRAAIYSRKSVRSETGDSIENQVALCTEYIRSHWPEAEICVFEDEGFSGATIHRPQFQALMETVKTGALDVLVCYRLDRVSRSVSDFTALIETLHAQQVDFICIREQFDTHTPMGKAMLYIASVFAQLERETIAERVYDNMQLLARTGQWLGGRPPLGFESVLWEQQTAAGKKRCHVLKKQREQAEIVQKAFTVFGETGSLWQTGEILCRHGIQYTQEGIKSMLRNPVYCQADEKAYDYFASMGATLCFDKTQARADRGLMVYNKRMPRKKVGAWRPADQWIVAMGPQEGLIQSDLWLRVQQKLLAHRALRKPHNEYALFSGLLYCGLCGAPMEAKKRSGGGFDYLCRQKRRHGRMACNCQNLEGVWTDQQLEQAIWKKMRVPCEQAAKGQDKDRKVQRQVQQALSLLQQLPDMQPVQQWLQAQMATPVQEEEKRPFEEDVYQSIAFAQRQALYRRVISRIVWDQEHLQLYFL